MEKEVIEDHKLKCPMCSSGFVYVRLKTNEVVCRVCGNISEIKEREKTDG